MFTDSASLVFQLLKRTYEYTHISLLHLFLIYMDLPLSFHSSIESYKYTPIALSNTLSLVQLFLTHIHFSSPYSIMKVSLKYIYLPLALHSLYTNLTSPSKTYKAWTNSYWHTFIHLLLPFIPLCEPRNRHLSFSSHTHTLIQLPHTHIHTYVPLLYAPSDIHLPPACLPFIYVGLEIDTSISLTNTRASTLHCSLSSPPHIPLTFWQEPRGNIKKGKENKENQAPPTITISSPAESPFPSLHKSTFHTPVIRFPPAVSNIRD